MPPRENCATIGSATSKFGERTNLREPRCPASASLRTRSTDRRHVSNARAVRRVFGDLAAKLASTAPASYRAARMFEEQRPPVRLWADRQRTSPPTDDVVAGVIDRHSRPIAARPWKGGRVAGVNDVAGFGCRQIGCPHVGRGLANNGTPHIAVVQAGGGRSRLRQQRER